ncbi:MAG TPA: exopolysaccharide transport family protein [Methylocystis sp.]|nr:exopolysaccharide transport family protein [Methylocystis sp.]
MSVTTNEAGGEIDLAQIGRAVSAKRWWVIAPTLAAFVCALIFVNVVRPRYAAEARLLLETQESFLPHADKATHGTETAPDAEAVQSQLELLKSRDLSRRVIKMLGLQGNEEFDPLAKGVGLTTRALVMVGLMRDPTRVSPEDRMLDVFADRLNVLSPQKTRVLGIEFTTRDPDLSARGANAVAESYLEFQQEAKRDSARDAAKALSAVVADMQRRVTEAEARVEEFRAGSGLLLGANNTNVNAQHLTDLNTQLSLARSAQADAQSKARLLKDMLRQNRVGDIPDVANNEVMRRLQEQRVTLRAQLALELRTLLPGHPRIKELEAQLGDLDRQTRAAAERVARTLENEARIAGGRVENLAAALEEQKQIVSSSEANEARLRELESQAHVLKEQFENDEARYQEAIARENAQATPADARIIQRALSPQTPSFPKKLPIVAFATLAALALSIGAIVSSELLSGRAQAHPMAFAPMAAHEEPGGAPTARAAEEATPPELVEARGDDRRISDRREIVSNIDAARLAASCVKVLIVRGDAGDASLATVIAVSRALARRGRAILVAADGAGLETLSAERDERRAGLAELLAGEAEFGDVIYRDAASRLHFIAAGGAAGEPRYDASLVVEALTQTYDFVVFCAQDGDGALALASLFDKILLRAEDPQAAQLAQRLAAQGCDVSVVEAAEGDLAAA